MCFCSERNEGEMTNQNVVVSDAKSGINVAITVAVSGSSRFQTAAQKPPAVPGTYITISKKKLVQNLDINSSTRINAWVDSMRASSPTHIKSQPQPLSDVDQTSWNVRLTFSLIMHTRTHTHRIIIIIMLMWMYIHIHTYIPYTIVSHTCIMSCLVA